jgi:hypothetical protein
MDESRERRLPNSSWASIWPSWSWRGQDFIPAVTPDGSIGAAGCNADTPRNPPPRIR